MTLGSRDASQLDSIQTIERAAALLNKRRIVIGKKSLSMTIIDEFYTFNLIKMHVKLETLNLKVK